MSESVIETKNNDSFFSAIIYTIFHHTPKLSQSQQKTDMKINCQVCLIIIKCNRNWWTEEAKKRNETKGMRARGG